MSNADVPWVETWKGIAALCHRSERWCRYMARRAADPLPVFKVGGIVRLTQDDLAGWLRREQERSTVTRPHAAAAAAVADDEYAHAA